MIVAPVLNDLDALEAIDQEEPLRDLVLRIARIAREGRLAAVAHVVAADDELDGETRAWVLRLAGDEPFLRLAESYLERCRDLN